MKDLSRLMLVLVVWSAWAGWATAKVPLGGLAVAVSPDGQTIVMAGDNRVLYVVEAASLEVKQRIWLTSTIYSLHFNKAGDKLLAEDTDDTVLLVDTQSWKVEKEVQKASVGSPSLAADTFAGLDTNYSGHVIRFLSMSDLSEKGKVTFEKGRRVVSHGLAPDGTRLAVLTEGVKDDSEPTAKETPKDLRGLALDEFRQKNDGRTSSFLLFEVPSGKKSDEQKLFFTTSQECKVFFGGDDVYLVNYSNLNAKVSKDGQVTLFQMPNSFNYGMGVSADHKVLLTGGMSDGTCTVVDGMKMSPFKRDRLAGWPEYFKSFAVAADGTGYGATSGFRLLKISSGGQVEKAVPIY
jgi:WD40 repeat protein